MSPGPLGASPTRQEDQPQQQHQHQEHDAAPPPPHSLAAPEGAGSIRNSAQPPSPSSRVLSAAAPPAGKGTNTDKGRDTLPAAPVQAFDSFARTASSSAVLEQQPAGDGQGDQVVAADNAGDAPASFRGLPCAVPDSEQDNDRHSAANANAKSNGDGEGNGDLNAEASLLVASPGGGGGGGWARAGPQPTAPVKKSSSLDTIDVPDVPKPPGAAPPPFPPPLAPSASLLRSPNASSPPPPALLASPSLQRTPLPGPTPLLASPSLPRTSLPGGPPAPPMVSPSLRRSSLTGGAPPGPNLRPLPAPGQPPALLPASSLRLPPPGPPPLLFQASPSFSRNGSSPAAAGAAGGGLLALKPIGSLQRNQVNLTVVSQEEQTVAASRLAELQRIMKERQLRESQTGCGGRSAGEGSADGGSGRPSRSSSGGEQQPRRGGSGGSGDSGGSGSGRGRLRAQRIEEGEEEEDEVEEMGISRAPPAAVGSGGYAVGGGGGRGRGEQVTAVVEEVDEEDEETASLRPPSPPVRRTVSEEPNKPADAAAELRTSALSETSGGGGGVAGGKLGVVQPAGRSGMGGGEGLDLIADFSPELDITGSEALLGGQDMGMGMPGRVDSFKRLMSEIEL